MYIDVAQSLVVQDVLLLDSLRGSWDSSNVALYYSNLLRNATSATANGVTTAVSLQHQRQELDPAYKSVLSSFMMQALLIHHHKHAVTVCTLVLVVYDLFNPSDCVC